MKSCRLENYSNYRFNMKDVSNLEMSEENRQ